MYKSFSFPGNMFTIYSHSDGLPIFAVLPHRMKLQEKMKIMLSLRTMAIKYPNK